MGLPLDWTAVLRYLTAGESHGKALVVIVEGLPAGLPVVEADIGAELARRRLGYGRGPRMRFEADEITLIAGIRHGRTLGSPVAIEIANTEWPKWVEEMSPHPGHTEKPLTQPRPGHALHRRNTDGRQVYPGFLDGLRRLGQDADPRAGNSPQMVRQSGDTLQHGVCALLRFDREHQPSADDRTLTDIQCPNRPRHHQSPRSVVARCIISFAVLSASG